MATIKKLLLLSVLGLGVSMKTIRTIDLHVTDQQISNLVHSILVQYVTISTTNFAQILKELRNAILEIIAKASIKFNILNYQKHCTV